MIIKYDPTATDGGGAATVKVAPAAKPSVIGVATRPVNNDKSIKPEMPKAAPTDHPDFNISELPPLDASEGQLVSIDDKPVAKKGEAKDEKKVVTEPQKKDEKKEPEVKVDDKATKKDEKNPFGEFFKPPTKKGDEKKEVKIDDKGGEAFDYTGYPETEVKVLKNMSKESREYVTGLMKKTKELEKNKQEFFFQHPQAFTLTPEFEAAKGDYLYATKETSFWNEQLMLCKAGKPFKIMNGWDKDGNPIIVKDNIPANDAAEEELRKAVNSASGVAQGIQNNVNQFAATHSQRVQKDLQGIEQIRKEKFAWASNPEYMDYSIEIKGAGQKTVKEITNDIVEMFPSYMRNHPAVQVCADLFVSTRILAAQLEAAKAGEKIADTKLEETKLAEPSSQLKPKPAGEEINGVSNFSLSDAPDGLR